ncbi:extracellular calcium-sensing receptor-like [Dendronephthya gigantea]|uniref:extracellular calcium-sensing receptor-like n=1 Tax=Dendronephthya gigantea TaxID=151771 RepID=UPI00106B4021|nr:extracellular calcium-sensing receptor-like [Dendronephthya gigantea]
MTSAKRNTTKIFNVHLALSLYVFLLVINKAEVEAKEPILQKDGDYIIQALLPITRLNGVMLDTYAIASEIVRLTIDEINNGSDILQGIELGYEIVNDKLDLDLIMKRTVSTVSKYRPDSICREDEEFCTPDQKLGAFIDKRVTAVIGPATSGSSVPSASLLGLYNIPQVGYSASSKILSDKSRFKSFLRTIPSDKYQAEAIASFVKYFGWNYVFFIGSDDEYGRQGLASFKTAARKLKVCTADDANIPFQREDDAAKQVKQIIQDMKKMSHVQVAILFMFDSQTQKVLKEAERQGLRNVTWILSDATGTNIANADINKSLLNGAFGVDFVYKELPEIKKHLQSVTVETAAAHNPWLLRLMENVLNCSKQGLAGKRRCDKNEKFGKKLPSLANRWSRLISIVNSVKAVAHGLNNLLLCKGRLPSGLCANTSLPLKGKDLYAYMQNATFTGAMGEHVSFDESGDLFAKKYTFRNVLYDPENDTLEFKVVAKWSSTQPARPIFLKNGQGHDLTWIQGEVPSATCSQACQPGQKQVGQSDCCWACHPCPKGEISNTTGATVCHRCPSGSYANDDQTECLMTEIDYIQPSDAFSIVIITISCFGLVAMVIVAALFFYVKDTPLVQDSNPILLGLLLLSAALGFLYAIFQVSLYRNDDACRFLNGFLLFVVLLVGSTLLAKTKTCELYLKKYASSYAKPVAGYATPILVGAIMLFQLLLVGVWFLTDTPEVTYLKTSQALHIRECNSSWTAGRFVATGFPLVVLFLATAFAFKERDDRKNHSEAKYLSFCTISMCILLIAFFPTYRFAQGMTTSIVIATTSLVGALAVSGCIILPKVYILVVQPERNVPEEERERSHNTVSSAHTAGSQHQPVFSETVEELRPPNDVEFMSSVSSAHEAVKDVPVI